MNAIKNIFLFCIGILLIPFLVLIGIIIKIIKAIIKRKLNLEWFGEVVSAVSQSTAVWCDDMFNWLLLNSKAKLPFGSATRTISDVLNFNEKHSSGGVTWLGHLVRKIVNWYR